MLQTILNKRGLLAAGLMAVAAGLAACSPGSNTPSTEAGATAGSGGEVNIYSARHYDADEQLYELFERETGVQVNRIEAGADILIERLAAEGTASPADVVLLVDAGNYWRATERGLLASVESQVLNNAIPPHLRDAQGRWFGVAKRARVIVYRKGAVAPEQVATYEALADPALKGKVCSRPSSNIYNLSLMASLIEAWGEQRALAWANSVVANFARPPEGSDTDQIKAVADGACQVAIVNHYYLVRLMRSDKPEDRAVADKVGLVFPDQAGTGTHINISGAAVAANAPNRANAVRFLEFLVSPEAQKILAEANDEYPVVSSAAIDNPELAGLGAVQDSQMPLEVYGQRQAQAQRLFDRAGWR
jgi:iron(III) transport system substrate-binding protein